MPTYNLEQRREKSLSYAVRMKIAMLNMAERVGIESYTILIVPKSFDGCKGLEQVRRYNFKNVDTLEHAITSLTPNTETEEIILLFAWMQNEVIPVQIYSNTLYSLRKRLEQTTQQAK